MTLEVYRGDRLGAAQRWAELPGDELRRRGVTAARERDRATLWDLTVAHLMTLGREGAQVSPRTLRTYRVGAEHWLDYAGERAVAILRPARNAGPLFVRRLEARGLSPSTVRAYLAGARALYAALRWAGATDLDPFSDARAARDKTPAWEKRQPYEEHEVQALLGAGDARTRALVLLGAHGGLRVQEIVGLRWRDVNLEAGTARVLGKGRKVRTVNLSRSLVTALGVLGADVHPELFVVGATADAARRRLRLVCARAGVPYRGVHALRHYAGTRMVRAGLSLHDAARHLGHSSIETTQTYAKWADDSLKRALEGW
ncbi:tyrosine-type recombinase/integrase [Deinococcus planocerae]|uniref:tyrosine-type recombinase/integrase n=1 Tax=Deinococcus planocerae TaxID=1737569 RepID=UPI002481B808|nr:site-specific integrase [Deinococcus planocerae]